MRQTIIRSPIRSDQDVVLSRQRASQIAELLGFDQQSRTRIATSVSEIARNAHRYAGSGTVEFCIVDEEAPKLEVSITDKGHGIKDVDRILRGVYTSATGMGLGIIGARRLMDEFDINTGEKGTTVRMSRRLAGRPTPTSEEITEIARTLAATEPASVNEELHRQNLELISALEELNRRHEDLLRLDRELADTNRGVVALYAELDERAERLRNADMVKSRFLSFMSHEFRTPLSSILALARLLLDRTDGELGEEQEKQVQFIHQCARDLTDLVNDLLDLSKVEAGKSDVRVETFSLNSVFGALRGVMRPLLHNPAVELQIEIPEHEVTIASDQSKLAQILRNLVSNALKFTEKGSVRVTASVSDDGGRIVIDVSDTGIGIDANDFDLIFEEYGQVRNRFQRQVKGTGLGLPLSRRLAEVIGGTLTVVSEPGRGSCFTLDIPRNLKGAREHRRVRLVEGNGSGDVEPALCLVVDDEEPARYLMRRLLEEEGCDVIEASTGRDALQLIRTEHPEIVFLDLLMPDMLGFEVAGHILGDRSLDSVSMVMVTSKILSEEEHEQLVKLRVPLVPKQSLTKGVVRAVLSNRRTTVRNSSTQGRSIKR